MMPSTHLTGVHDETPQQGNTTVKNPSSSSWLVRILHPCSWVHALKNQRYGNFIVPSEAKTGGRLGLALVSASRCHLR